ncbi:uncharacterized protein [Mytilus edulis]|uniref:uncharacterized protein n=1 Tax=Mytilus edulis TaxID=6550 RepID=UPI0039F09249
MTYIARTEHSNLATKEVVLNAVRKNLISSGEVTLDTDCEISWNKIQVQGSKPLYTECFYRQPNNEAVSLQKLDESLGRLTHNQNLPNIVLTGDFNIPDIQWKDAYSIRSPQQYNLEVNETILNITNEHNLEQQNITPTRGNNILDLVFTTNNNLIESISVESGISHHEAVIVDIKTKVKLTKKKPRKTFLYSKGNIPAIKTRLKDEFPEYIKKTNNQSIEICWETFKTLLTSYINEHIPQKTCTKIKDETNTESPKQGITKQFWTYVKSRKQESSGVSTLNVDGQIKEDNTSKAEALNNQFQSVFTEEDMASFPNMGPSTTNKINDIKIEEKGIAKLLKQLNINKASGPDKISCRILKETADEISPYLKHIFERSLRLKQVQNIKGNS